MKTYIIKYEIHLKDGSVIRDKEMKVKKCTFGVEAQCKLEKYLKKKHDTFKKLIVQSCKEDIMSMFGDIFDGGNFDNLFAGGNKFN